MSYDQPQKYTPLWEHPTRTKHKHIGSPYNDGRGVGGKGIGKEPKYHHSQHWDEYDGRGVGGLGIGKTMENHPDHGRGVGGLGIGKTMENHPDRGRGVGGLGIGKTMENHPDHGRGVGGLGIGKTMENHPDHGRGVGGLGIGKTMDNHGRGYGNGGLGKQWDGGGDASGYGNGGLGKQWDGGNASGYGNGGLGKGKVIKSVDPEENGIVDPGSLGYGMGKVDPSKGLYLVTPEEFEILNGETYGETFKGWDRSTLHEEAIERTHQLKNNTNLYYGDSRNIYDIEQRIQDLEKKRQAREHTVHESRMMSDAKQRQTLYNDGLGVGGLGIGKGPQNHPDYRHGYGNGGIGKQWDWRATEQRQAEGWYTGSKNMEIGRRLKNSW